LLIPYLAIRIENFPIPPILPNALLIRENLGIGDALRRASATWKRVRGPIINKSGERCLPSGLTRRTEDINFDVFLQNVDFEIHNIDIVVSGACISNNLPNI
jgi:hypothetical protein